MERYNDIKPPPGERIPITIDGESVEAVVGETLLSTLFALGSRDISLGDHGNISGAYCGMGICYCCAVNINGTDKRRACQTVVESGMQVKTKSNRHSREEPGNA